MVTRVPTAAEARAVVSEVEDPELPMVTLGDLGMIRAVRVNGARAEVDLAPTYSGCPATEVIAEGVRSALERYGFSTVEVRLVRSPPWTTNWITDRGRARLREAGVAPPEPILPHHGPSTLPLFEAAPRPACPLCGANTTERISEHGSTPCKSLHRCLACLEPFESFKRH